MLVCAKSFLGRFFEKKLRKKLSCGKFLGYFQKSTLDLYQFYAEALFRQQIFNASAGERSDLMKGSLREGAGAGRDWRSTRAV